MWSWVVLVRPSKRRLIARRNRPQTLLLLGLASRDGGFLDDDEEEEDGWCRVKTATPVVTSSTTRYL